MILPTSFIASSRFLTTTNDESIGFNNTEPDEESTLAAKNSADDFGKEAEESNQFAVITSIVVIILLLITLTIAFEQAKHKILHSADKNMKPIIASLFGEMTVLGFLSLFTFCVTQLGAFKHLSVKIFGKEEEEELLEIFEGVHYMLFGVMVFFVTSVLVLVKGAKRMEDDWYIMDMACRSPKYLQALANNMDNGVYEGQRINVGDETTWRSYLTRSFSLSTRYFSDLTLYYGIRNEFLLDRSTEPPFEALAIGEDNNLSEDFNFGRYLSICLGHTLSHVVELEEKTWGFLGFLTLLYYVLLLSTKNDIHVFAWVWVATGWILFLYRNYFDYHIWSIQNAMARPFPTRILSAFNGDEERENSPLLSSYNAALPAWAKIEMDDHHSTSPHNHHNTAIQKMTRQDALYWMGRHGPESYRLVFQIQLVFTSAYISLLLLTLYPYMVHNTSTVELVLYVIFSLLPFGLLLGTLRRSAANMTIVCNIGVHRKPQTIAQVIREEKTERIIRSVILLQKLQHASKSPDGLTNTRNGTSATTLTPSQEIEMKTAKKTFQTMDKSGNGTLEVLELEKLMKILGAPTTDDSLQAIVKLLDTNNDGTITMNEFLNFYRNNVVLLQSQRGAHHRHHSNHHSEIHELAHELFQQFDRDESQSITLSEFKSMIESFHVGFTIDELGELVNEIDHDNTGYIGIHEFVSLLENHRHLFQQYQLPPV